MVAYDHERRRRTTELLGLDKLGAYIAGFDANVKMPAMIDAKCLNAYHRDYSKRMKRSAARRSKQPPMSPEEFMQQVSRLGQGHRQLKSVA